VDRRPCARPRRGKGDRREFDELIAVDDDAWRRELEQHADWFEKLGARVPQQLRLKRELIVARLSHASAA
jgi:GTP-dependent phosphoenolpyruvate carboxykinase